MESTVLHIITQELTPLLPGKPIQEMLELYVAFSEMETPVEQGIRVTWLDNVASFYQPSAATMRNSHEHLLNSESFLKKVLYTVMPKTYEECAANPTLSFSFVADALGLQKLFEDNNPMAHYNAQRDSGKTKTLRSCIAQAYKLRNTDAHTSDDWSLSQMISNVNAIMVTTLSCVWMHKDIIRQQISTTANNNHFGIDKLLKSLVKEYDQKRSEGFRYVPLVWQNSADKQTKQMQLDELLTDKQILLSGDAGCGKTTALDQLEYQAAQKYLTGKTSVIPAKLALINEQPTLTLTEMICHRLNIPSDYCETLLKQNNILLLIDGLNELTTNPELKSNFVIALEQFIAAHPQTAVVVTDRRYSPFLIRIKKTYQLKPLEKADIIRYAESRPEYNSQFLDLLATLLEKPSFAELEFTPLLINQLLLGLNSHRELPEDLSDLIGIYLDSLLAREYTEKRDLNAAPGKLDVFLMKLAATTDIGNTVPLYAALKLCTEAMREFGVQADSYALINLAVQLAILQLSDGHLSFILDEYHTYYLLKSIEAGM